MNEQLRDLLTLQNIDLEIKKAIGSHHSLDDQLAELRRGIAFLTNELEKQRLEYEETRRLRAEHESALKAYEEAKARAKAKLSAVRNPKEHMAVQREIEAATKGIAAKEEEILKIIEVEEKVRRAYEDRKAKLGELEAATDAFEAEYGGKVAEVKGHMEELQAERAELIARLPKKLVRQYERISKARDGVVLARVKDERCLECNMGLPPQLYNIILRGEELVSCPHCQRILYYEPERVAQDSEVEAAS